MVLKLIIVVLVTLVGYFGGKSWALSERLKECEACKSHLKWQVEELNSSIVQGTCLLRLDGGLK